MPDRTLTTAVLNVASALARISDDALVADWPEPSEPGGFWYGYDDTAREVAFCAYQELRNLASVIAVQRPASTEAQRILAQHQVAYRDLTGALAGVGDDHFDLPPAENEWPLRTVLYHIGLTERGFHALIHWAVSRQGGGGSLPIEMADEYRDEVSDRIDESGTLDEVLARFDALHLRVLADFSGLDDTDLAAPNIWWEGYEVPVRFRLHRFDTHLREHTIQVDKTLAGIGHSPTEPERLARLLHRALGEVEGALLGAPDVALDRQRSVVAMVDQLTTTLRSLPS
ncbi:MAG TPA: DinB family protein [Thermomicrobiales bacterium]|nr:DinB family protein [Thermomicrobiales bacterium]